MLTADTWLLPYSREKAYPLEYVADNKFWPSVRRGRPETYGDRNLILSY
jgi:glycine dehydrogenase